MTDTVKKDKTATYFGAITLALEGFTFERQIEQLHGDAREIAEAQDALQLITDAQAAGFLPPDSKFAAALRTAIALFIDGVKNPTSATPTTGVTA